MGDKWILLLPLLVLPWAFYLVVRAIIKDYKDKKRNPDRYEH